MFMGAAVSEIRVAGVVEAAPEDTSGELLMETLTSPATLEAAWRTVLARDARDGELKRQTEEIASDLDRVLADLAEQLRDGTYAPAPLARVRIPKRVEGEDRVLEVPAVRDRIVERAVVDVLGQRVDALMSPYSFGYEGSFVGRRTSNQFESFWPVW